jgi:hypothetical protein
VAGGARNPGESADGSETRASLSVDDAVLYPSNYSIEVLTVVEKVIRPAAPLIG